MYYAKHFTYIVISSKCQLYEVETIDKPVSWTLGSEAQRDDLPKATLLGSSRDREQAQDCESRDSGHEEGWRDVT